jgi:hypothetical protein
MFIDLAVRRVSVNVSRLQCIAAAVGGLTLWVVAKCPVANEAPAPDYEPVIDLNNGTILRCRESLVQVLVLPDRPNVLLGDFVTEVPAGWGLFIADRPMVSQMNPSFMAWSFSGIARFELSFL